MIRIVSLLILLQTFLPIAEAGMIYGKLTGEIDMSGVEVVLRITCSKSEYDIGKVVIGSAYLCDVVETGPLQLQVEYNDQKIRN